MRAALHHCCLFTLLVGTACGDFVRYEGQAPSGGPTVNLDEATKMAYENATTLTHASWSGLLARYLSEDETGQFVYVDYDGLSSNPEAMVLLDQYLAGLSYVSPDKLESTQERLAFWLNAYNASVIREVISKYNGDHGYSVEEGGFIFFDELSHTFAGRTMTLDQIEHIIIRADPTHEAYINAGQEQLDALLPLHEQLWEGAPVDARIHAAVNCAALGCPNLPNQTPYAFRADLIESQLESAANAFANNAAKGAGPDGISQLFDWYAADWELSFGSAINFIEKHRDGGLEGVNINKFIDYNWGLNIAPE